MKTVSLKLPTDLDARLSAVARRAGSTKSAVMRDALEAYFSGNNGLPLVSCLDLVGDLAGSVEGGPPDLSTNKRYMEGYGR